MNMTGRRSVTANPGRISGKGYETGPGSFDFYLSRERQM